MVINYLGHFEGCESFGCNAGCKMVYVDAFGEVSPCVFLPFSFGNVRSGRLRRSSPRCVSPFPGEPLLRQQNYRELGSGPRPPAPRPARRSACSRRGSARLRSSTACCMGGGPEPLLNPRWITLDRTALAATFAVVGVIFVAIPPRCWRPSTGWPRSWVGRRRRRNPTPYISPSPSATCTW